MRPRLAAVVLGLAGLLVAVAVGLAANSIASRSFTPGADALPSAGSLAPLRTAPGAGTAPTTTSKPKPKPKPKPVTTPATTPATTLATTVDDHGGKGKGGSGDSGGHGSGKHGNDD
jgi:hypothetical protein